MFLRRTWKTNWTTNKKYYSYSLVESIKWKWDKYYKHKFIVSVWKLDDFHDEEIKELEQYLIQEITWNSQKTLSNIKTKKVEEKYDEIIKKYYNNIKLKKDDKKIEEKIDKLRKTGQFIEINPKSTTQSDVKNIWNEIICNNIYNELEMDDIFNDCGFTKRQTEVMRMLILWRTIDPKSELWTIDWAQNFSWLSELAWINYTNLWTKTVYSLLKKVEKNQSKIEKHLENKESTMFPEDRIILYDLTNVYFEWKWLWNDYAQYWRSKEKRSDCVLMWLWLIINQNGFVKTSKVFKWNQWEPITFKDMVKSMEEKQANSLNEPNNLTLTKSTVIMDAWIATEENIQFLKDNNYTYVVVKKWTNVEWTQLWDYTLTKQFFNENWKILNEIEIRRNKTEKELFLECKSKKKNDKETSIMSKLEWLMNDRLKSLSDSIEKWTINNEATINKKLWVIQWKYTRVSKYYDIKIDSIDELNETLEWDYSKSEMKKTKRDNNKTKKYSLNWEINEEKKEKYKIKREKYILRTNLCNLTDEEIWDIYNMIRRVEDSFRTLKTDLRIRPIYHQTRENCIAHIFISVLAYHIVNIVLYRLKEKWINIKWSTFLQNMSTQILSTITQNTITWDSIKIRTMSNPTEQQKKYYDILKINSLPYKTRLLTHI